MGLYRPPIELVPHPFAPEFDHADGGLILQQLAGELTSSNMHLNNTIRLLIAKAGLVSLWFWTKYIAGFAGPYDQLTDHLHVDMCNFRQRLLYPGARGAIFLPRGHGKTIINTEQAAAWEGVRNPNLTHRITHAKEDTAGDFFKSIKTTFDSNLLVKECYGRKDDPWGCYVPEKNAPRWNETEIVFPNRTRNFREASVEYGGVGGASEGKHFMLHTIDDMLGLRSLNAGRISSADMTRTRNWFWASEKTLLSSMRRGRVIVTGTRYAPDDAYQDIYERCGEAFGYPNPDLIPGRGSWKIYYRKAVEDGEVIFPEDFSEEGYAEIARDDYWTWISQYQNEPQNAGMSEFINFTVYPVEQYVKPNGTRWVRGYDPALEVNFDEPLKWMDVIQAADPAATEKYINARTSKTSQGVLAADPKRRLMLLDYHTGYVEVSTLFDWLFESKEKFKHYLRGLFLEQNGAFRMLGPFIHQEERVRGVYLNVEKANATSEKVGRIRTTLEPILHDKRLYADKRFLSEIIESVKSFPSRKGMDTLDMLTIGAMKVRIPVRDPSTEDWDEEEDEEDLEDPNTAWWKKTARFRGRAGY